MVAVITLNYNQNEYTLKCVDSILKSDCDNFKLFLIDNGSEASNFKELKNSLPNSPLVELCRIEKNRGYVGGVNYGLEKASAFNPDYYLVMNNDTILDENAILELVKTSKDFDDKAIVTGKVYHYDDPDKFQDVGYYFRNKRLEIKRIGLDETDNGQFNNIAERDMLDDIFWLFPSKLYKEIGGYSNYFWFNAEQADFALRAKHIGYKLVYTPKANIWHKGSISVGGRNKNPKLAYWHIQSSLILRFLHLNRIDFIVFFIGILKSVLETTIKAYFKFIMGDKSLLKYAAAKRAGFKYFLIWLVKKNDNLGTNPF